MSASPSASPTRPVHHAWKTYRFLNELRNNVSNFEGKNVRAVAACNDVVFFAVLENIDGTEKYESRIYTLQNWPNLMSSKTDIKCEGSIVFMQASAQAGALLIVTEIEKEGTSKKEYNAGVYSSSAPYERIGEHNITMTKEKPTCFSANDELKTLYWAVDKSVYTWNIPTRSRLHNYFPKMEIVTAAATKSSTFIPLHVCNDPIKAINATDKGCYAVTTRQVCYVEPSSLNIVIRIPTCERGIWHSEELKESVENRVLTTTDSKNNLYVVDNLDGEAKILSVYELVNGDLRKRKFRNPNKRNDVSDAKSLALKEEEKFDVHKIFIFKDYLIATRVQNSSYYQQNKPLAAKELLFRGYELNVSCIFGTAESEKDDSATRFFFTAWGVLGIVKDDGRMDIFEESNDQAKINQLYQKEDLDTALRLARLRNMDQATIATIHRIRGDKWYSLPDGAGFDNAIEEYVRAIEVVEPSYVIKKFLGHRKHLEKYLETIHMMDHPHVESNRKLHTRLLFDCYIKGVGKKHVSIIKSALKARTNANAIANMVNRHRMNMDTCMSLLKEFRQDMGMFMKDLDKIPTREDDSLISVDPMQNGNNRIKAINMLKDTVDKIKVRITKEDKAKDRRNHMEATTTKRKEYQNWLSETQSKWITYNQELDTFIKNLKENVFCEEIFKTYDSDEPKPDTRETKEDSSIKPKMDARNELYQKINEIIHILTNMINDVAHGLNSVQRIIRGDLTSDIIEEAREDLEKYYNDRKEDNKYAGRQRVKIPRYILKGDIMHIPEDPKEDRFVCIQDILNQYENKGKRILPIKLLGKGPFIEDLENLKRDPPKEGEKEESTAYIHAYVDARWEMTKNPKFDVESAIDILMPVRTRSADRTYEGLCLEVAKAFEVHNMALELLYIPASESESDKAALAMAKYFKSINGDVVDNLLKYGPILIEKLPDSGDRKFGKIVAKICKRDGFNTCRPEVFKTIFAREIHAYYNFLSVVIEENPDEQFSEDVWNDYILCALRMDPKAAISILTNERAIYSTEHILMVVLGECDKWESRYKDALKPMELDDLKQRLDHLRQCRNIIWRKRGLYLDVIDNSEGEEILIECRNHPERPDIWKRGFMKLTTGDKNDKSFWTDKSRRDLFDRFVDEVLRRKMMSMNEVLEFTGKVSTRTPMQYGLLKDKVVELAHALQQDVREKTGILQQLTSELQKCDKDIREMTKGPYKIKPNSQCSICKKRLTVPFKGFQCGHQFDMQCLGDEAQVCPLCKEEHMNHAKEKMDVIEFTTAQGNEDALELLGKKRRTKIVKDQFNKVIRRDEEPVLETFNHILTQGYFWHDLLTATGEINSFKNRITRQETDEQSDDDAPLWDTDL